MKMMKSILFLMVFFLAISPKDALALRCGNKLVEVGDKKAEVILKCGNPAFVEKYREKVIVYREFGGKVIKGTAVYRYVEEWTYNFGSNRFLYFLKFVNDKLSHIEEGRLGYDGPLPKTGKATCGQRVEVGDRKIEVLMKCGQPTLVDKRSEEQLHSRWTEEGRIFEERETYTTIEEWTYNFGPNNFMYSIKFENGRVRKVESGDYGF